MRTKICIGKLGCGKEKELTEFHKDKSRKDGLCPYCKDCNKIRVIKYSLNHKKEKSKYDKKEERD